jgi:signal transduction histidine kinase
MTPESVLIAEDSPTQALRLKNTLEKNGFTVTVARDGREALDALTRSRPTLVISDIQMPEMDGYELCRRVKADPLLRDLPLILLTSLAAPQDLIQGLACGADNFVVKPYGDDFLLSRIRTVLANRDLGAPAESGAIPVHFAGERFEIAADRRQILNLLLSTYETAVKTNTDLIAAHEALKAAQAQLIEAEKMQTVGRLAAGVAHEVRNPLAIIEMGLDCLGGKPGEADPILEEMHGAVKRANVVVTGLADLASPGAAGVGDADLHGAIEHALEALADELDRAHVHVVQAFAPDLRALRLDADRIAQVFVNVIANAVQAMPKGGTLTVATRLATLGPAEVAFEAGNRSGIRFREGDRVVIAEVRDTGHGLAPEILGKVFDPFFSTRPTGEGMGLGLTVARKLTEMHHGTLAIASDPRGGAVVTLTFKTP